MAIDNVSVLTTSILYSTLLSTVNMATKSLFPVSLKRPSRTLFKQQCRCLSSTPRASYPQGSGEGTGSAIRSAVQRSMSGQSSMQGQISKMKKSDMPTDFGLVPDILIKPDSLLLPSLRSKRGLRTAWLYIKQKSKHFFG